MKRKQDETNVKGGEPTERRFKRHSKEFTYKQCLFCSSSDGLLHNYATENAERKLCEMATQMQDTKLLSKIAGGDIVAIEAKYHRACLVGYNKTYGSFLSQKSQPENVEKEQSKAQAFAELVAYMENSVEDGTNIFKLGQLADIYEKRLKMLGHPISFNRSHLNKKLLAHFEDTGLQEQKDGKHVILIFPDGMKEILKEAFKSRDYQREALLFSEVAKICRRELLQEYKFSGYFAEQCQNNLLPLTQVLVSMILYGPNSEETTDDQPSWTISPLQLKEKKKGRCTTPKTCIRQRASCACVHRYEYSLLNQRQNTCRDIEYWVFVFHTKASFR